MLFDDCSISSHSKCFVCRDSGWQGVELQSTNVKYLHFVKCAKSFDQFFGSEVRCDLLGKPCDVVTCKK